MGAIIGGASAIIEAGGGRSVGVISPWLELAMFAILWLVVVALFVYMGWASRYSPPMDLKPRTFSILWTIVTLFVAASGFVLMIL
jgi:hypothetical protein